MREVCRCYRVCKPERAKPDVKSMSKSESRALIGTGFAVDRRKPHAFVSTSLQDRSPLFFSDAELDLTLTYAYTRATAETTVANGNQDICHHNTKTTASTISTTTTRTIQQHLWQRQQRDRSNVSSGPADCHVRWLHIEASTKLNEEEQAYDCAGILQGVDCGEVKSAATRADRPEIHTACRTTNKC